jgi:hypothetical protein
MAERAAGDTIAPGWHDIRSPLIGNPTYACSWSKHAARDDGDVGSTQFAEFF